MKKSVIFLTAIFLLPVHFAKAQFSGDGSEETPFVISNVSELATLAANVNSGNDYNGLHFSLIADIDLSGIANWTPVGGGSNAFKGVFHGSNRIISGLTASGVADIGLFGFISGATIENLYVIGGNISGTDQRKGVLAGAAAENSVIRNCYVSGTVSGNLNNGGIAGELRASSVSGCYSAVDVSGDNTLGGLVGYYRDNSAITNSYSTGNVSGKNHLGGVVGYGRYGGTVSYCYSTGNISGVGAADEGIGGIVGTIRDNTPANAPYTIQNNVAINGAISSTYTTTAVTNRIIGRNRSNSTPNNNYALQSMTVNDVTVTGTVTNNNGSDKEVSDFRSLSLFNTAENWTSNAWSMDAGTNAAESWIIWEGKSYPYLQTQSAPAAAITSQANGVLAYELRNNAEKVVVTAENGDILKTETSVAAGEQTITVPGLTDDMVVIFTVYETGKMPSYPVKAVYSYTQTGINTIEGKTLRVYFNSAQDQLSVESNKGVIKSIKLYNFMGILLGNYTVNASETTLNLSTLTKGSYILKVDDTAVKFIKK